MQLNRLIPAILALFWMAPHVATAQQTQGAAHSVDLHAGPEFDAFVAEEGWIFVADMTKGEGFPDLAGTASADGTAELTAADFDPETFDPRQWAIVYNVDPVLPTNFRIGDKGVVQFHSAQRCQDLYARHLARQAKGQR